MIPLPVTSRETTYTNAGERSFPRSVDPQATGILGTNQLEAGGGCAACQRGRPLGFQSFLCGEPSGGGQPHGGRTRHIAAPTAPTKPLCAEPTGGEQPSHADMRLSTWAPGRRRLSQGDGSGWDPGCPRRFSRCRGWVQHWRRQLTLRQGQNGSPQAHAGPLRGAAPELPHPSRQCASPRSASSGRRAARGGWSGVQCELSKHKPPKT